MMNTVLRHLLTDVLSLTIFIGACEIIDRIKSKRRINN